MFKDEAKLDGTESRFDPLPYPREELMISHPESKSLEKPVMLSEKASGREKQRTWHTG